jgi:hypothetical protein
MNVIPGSASPAGSASNTAPATDLLTVNPTKPKRVLPWHNRLEEVVNDNDVRELSMAEESSGGEESEDCTDTEIDSEPPIDPELYSCTYQVIRPKPHIIESMKRAKEQIPPQSKNDDSDPFEALEINHAAAAARRLSIAARRKGFAVKGAVSKMQIDMGYGDPARGDEYHCLRV